MAITNHERVGKALEFLRSGLAPYVEREVKAAVQAGSLSPQAVRGFLEDPALADKSIGQYDVSALMKLMWETWNDVFRRPLSFAHRSLVSEIRDWRNKWAHQQPFSSDDADRALDSMERLLNAVSAAEAEDVRRMKLELRRLVADEQVRGERRKTASLPLESAASASLKPWRELITPHRDVAGGHYQSAEFAADLWQVHLGEGADEYRKPAEFFRRTYLTESLRRLLTGALRRIAHGNGDPVVQLQTNFGGGKTHSMLALYHLFSGIEPAQLLGVDELMAAAGITALPSARRVVLVGNKISPGNPARKPDGTVVRTLWGELAWQLGGAQAFARIAEDDARATSPGDALRELFNAYGPCIVLIDEWVAYARQLHDHKDLPAGDFETQFSFAQALTESAKLARNCLLVVSLPASDTGTSPHSVGDDEEVGGERGRAALLRLRNVIGRLDAPWTPATAEEGFEIVRRRLFEPMTDPEHFKQRDVVARAFHELYLAQRAEFPAECADADYEKRLRAAYPIHPEVFDRLYRDWGSLPKFQRTRGVLRLMAAVIHCLWERGDRNPLIMPATLPIDDARVRDELTRYLSDSWKPIIESDVDGPASLPLRIDADVPNLGKLSATRRVARTIYLGSAPLEGAANMGLDDRRVKLGSAMPGEPVPVFGDAMRRLAAAATYLYQDGARYWYSTQPTVAKLARDRANQLLREPDKVAHEIEQRLRSDVAQRGEFERVVVMPASGADVADELETRLVVLGPEHAYSKSAANAAEAAAKALLESRGNAPRLYRNTLVFAAPDATRLQDLEGAVRDYLAWSSIVAQKDELNLTPHQARQAETQLRTATTTVQARLPETYQWLLVPEQTTPQSSVTWEALKLGGTDALPVRAAKKLRSEDLLFTTLGGTRLRMAMDQVPLWRGNHVAIAQLVQDFASYLYLPRLAKPSVLSDAARAGLALLTWEQDTFAYAEGYDAEAQRYRGLQCSIDLALKPDDAGLLVKPAVARLQLDREAPAPGAPTPSAGAGAGSGGGTAPQTGGAPGGGASSPASPARPKRFYGSVTLDPERVGRDAGQIASEVIAHLEGLVGARVRVTLEIEAEIPNGVPENVVRIVTENARTLKFDAQGFERE
ncbi:Swt1 family HEPN domain-containing protein [Azohydromonas sediminis]|uniref:Swt1 family HEPN domain-containing protein n=1 Tax=Azohydromonas sediminis TaxID=2259674 RepID=UPI000E64A8E1|nr:Swt1 family HEPN domain-containing protein [Azohydromonas sediminis]